MREVIQNIWLMLVAHEYLLHNYKTWIPNGAEDRAMINLLRIRDLTRSIQKLQRVFCECGHVQTTYIHY